MGVGLNGYVAEETQPLELYEHDPQEEECQLGRLAEVRRTRDSGRTQRALEDLRRAAEGDANVMPHVLASVQAMATEGEVMGALQEVYGEYRDPGVF